MCLLVLLCERGLATMIGSLVSFYKAMRRSILGDTTGSKTGRHRRLVLALWCVFVGDMDGLSCGYPLHYALLRLQTRHLFMSHNGYQAGV